jgi:hypothetical protein
LQFLCRLSVLYGVPVSEVARWPADEVRLLRHYLAKQPAPIERVEIAIARLTAIWVNAHRDRNAKAVETIDFLPFHSPEWVEAPADTPYAAANRGFLQALRKISEKVRS